MGAAENRAKSSAMAAYMKAKGITRTTSACPWHCGAMVRNGGEALLNHLNVCRGGGVKALRPLPPDVLIPRLARAAPRTSRRPGHNQQNRPAALVSTRWRTGPTKEG